MRDVLESMNRVGIFPQQIRASGGGARSVTWRQIQADVFNKEVTTVSYNEEASALGAAIIAGIGAGIWSTVEEATSLLKIESCINPLPENTIIYQQIFALHQRVYDQLQPTFHRLRHIHN